MNSTTSFALGDHFREFAQRKVREGRYASTSEVVRAGLRLLEEREPRADWLTGQDADASSRAGSS